MDNEIQITCVRCEHQVEVYRWSLRSMAALENALPLGWVVRREPKGPNRRLKRTVYCPVHADDAPAEGMAAR